MASGRANHEGRGARHPSRCASQVLPRVGGGGRLSCLACLRASARRAWRVRGGSGGGQPVGSGRGGGGAPHRKAGEEGGGGGWGGVSFRGPGASAPAAPT